MTLIKTALTRRTLLSTGIAAAAATLPNLLAANTENTKRESPKPLKVQRLSWAGIKLELAETTLFIDPWINASIWDGTWNLPIAPIEVITKRRSALVTHLHNDHFDPEALKQIVGDSGQVFCHSRIAAGVASRGFRVRAVEHYTPEVYGDFTITPVPASDGLGESQVSWVIRHGEKTFIHCGDTLWHGEFWKISRLFGPFDTAFLPINGVVIPRLQPQSELPCSMTPEQAIAAAVVLRARLVIPIHYGFSDDSYREFPGAESSFRQVAQVRGVDTRILAPGEWLV